MLISSNDIDFTRAIIKGYRDDKKTRKEIEDLTYSNVVYISSFIASVYDNTRDIKDFLKIVIKEEEINLALKNAMDIYMIRNGENQKEKYKYIDFLETTNDVAKEFLIYLEDMRKEKFENILQYKEFFDKKEIVKWLPTNNRKTKEFYADYGLEVNELIKYIRNDIVDYDFKETINKLKITSFLEYLQKKPSNLGIRAILTSIIHRERFGVGSISRAIADGIVSLALETYKL